MDDWEIGPALSLLPLGLVLALCLLQYFHVASKGVDAPLVGHRSWYEPRFAIALRFKRKASKIIEEGHRKYKDSAFKVFRTDKSIIVLPKKHLYELRSLPEEQVSAVAAHVANVAGKHTATDILLESKLHVRMLQSKLTPNIGSFIPMLQAELEFALAKEMPECNDQWETLPLYRNIVRVVARVSAIVLVGPSLSRNEEWINISIRDTESIFKTVTVLRFFPPNLRSTVAFFLPQAWMIRYYLYRTIKLIGPIIADRRHAESSGHPGALRPDDLLQWMMDAANEVERQPGKLAHLELMTSVASVHTTAGAATHALYDLCQRPEYIGPLRDEVEEVLREEGGWHKTTLHRLRKLDSFLKESQRFNPPSSLSFNRTVLQPTTLSSGLHLPASTSIGFAAAAILFDPSSTSPSPELFDGFRYYKRRLDPSESTKHQFAATDAENLHFGHGKHACPGRFLASTELKLLLAHLLLRYDFKFVDNAGRPENWRVDEFVFPDMNAKILVRKRAGG